MALAIQDGTTLYFGPWYRKSPFFEATRRAGCTAYDVYNHMYLPSYYDDPEVEYWALVRGVTIWDVGVERIVQISGPDAATFTNMLTCRDLTRCEVGQGKYMIVTAPDGGIVNDPVLLRIDEDRWWMALADSDAGLYALGVAVNSGMDVRIDHPEVYPLQVQGPKSRDVMTALFGPAILDLRYYRCARFDLDGIPLVISRTGWTAEIGYELYLMDASRGDDVWERIVDAGNAHGIRPIAPSEARRVEAGIFNYGSDMSIENNPFEIMGLERLVEPQQAEYIGKDALESVRREGVKRKLVGVDMGSRKLDRWLAEFWPAVREGERVGYVTEAVWSPRLERSIGYVWVPIDLAAPGTPIEVETPEGRVDAHIAEIPFVDPRKKVPSQ